MRGQDDQAGGRTAEEHRNGQSRRRRSATRTAKTTGSVPERRDGSVPERQRPTKTVVRRIGVASVLKVSIIFYVTVYCILLVAAVLLWIAADATGLRDNVEKVVADLIASGKFHFVGTELMQAGAAGGAMLVIFGTGFNVMLAILYNLITDVVGGVSIVVEERPAKRRIRRAAAVARRSSAERVRDPDPHLEPEPRPTPVVPKILIPEVELRRTRQPLPAPTPLPEVSDQRPGVSDDRPSVAEPAVGTNLDALGL